MNASPSPTSTSCACNPRKAAPRDPGDAHATRPEPRAGGCCGEPCACGPDCDCPPGGCCAG